MPAYINQRPVKTGCWTDREDELLAEWQGKYGNRFFLLIILHCHAQATTHTFAACISHSKHDAVPLAKLQGPSTISFIR